MKTCVIKVTSSRALPQALKVLEAGGLVAFPTDTVYGLGARVFDAEAVESIFTAKERPMEKAIPVLIGGMEDLEKVGIDIPAMALRLAAVFWPGALTLIIPKHHVIPPIVSSGPTIGVRVPDMAFTRHLLEATGPMAVTSANRSYQPNPLDANEVIAQLEGRLSLVLDGGRTPGGIPSTVIDCLGTEPKLLRLGPITLKQVISALKGT